MSLMDWYWRYNSHRAINMKICCYFCSVRADAAQLQLLHPKITKLSSCVTDKEPINPVGFPANAVLFLQQCCDCFFPHVFVLVFISVYFCIIGSNKDYFELNWIERTPVILSMCIVRIIGPSKWNHSPHRLCTWVFLWAGPYMGPVKYVKLRVRMRRECRERFPRHRG